METESRIPAVIFKEAVEAYRRNDCQSSLDACERLLEMSTPADALPAIHNLRALSLAGLGNIIDAVGAIQLALQSNPLDARLHLHAARLLARIGKNQLALEHAEKAASLAPSDTEPYYQAARIYQSSNQLPTAITTAQKCVKKKPSNVEAWMLLAELEAEQGNDKQALKYLRPALNRKPLQSRAWAWLAEMESRLQSGLPLEEKLLLAREEAATPADWATAEFALADLRRRSGEHSKAFAMYRAANEQLDKVQPFDIEAWESRVANLIADSTSETSGKRPTSEIPMSGSSADPRLTFILGMPRSGTSLCEQVLSAHPAVHGAGELPTMEYIENCLRQRGLKPYGGDNSGWQEEMRCVYLDSLPPLKHGERWITDKTPRNFERLGLILRLFPEARIVWLLRHPLDNVLSCYFQDFSSNHGYSQRLDHAALVYAGHLKLLRHWKKQFESKVQVVEYASLVQDIEGSARRMSDFMGLEFHSAMLQPHLNPRVVRTASAEQVRQPVSTRSLNSWRQYAGELEELMAQMRDLGLIDKSGASLWG